MLRVRDLSVALGLFIWIMTGVVIVKASEKNEWKTIPSTSLAQLEQKTNVKLTVLSSCADANFLAISKRLDALENSTSNLEDKLKTLQAKVAELSRLVAAKKIR